MDFFNKIGSKITTAGQGVQEQAKNLADISTVSYSITSKEKAIAELYMELGKEYYDSVEGIPSGLGDAFINKINQLEDEIVELQQDLNDLKGFINCSNCNNTMPSSANCCSNCGSVLQKSNHVESVRVNAHDVITCSNCGINIISNVNFCTGCGAPIK